MEHTKKEAAERKTVHGRRRPYEAPELTRHGDVEEITEVLRLAGSKGTVPSEPASDRNAKENFAPVDGRDILDRLAAIPIETWNYKDDDPSVRHIGPMAQDFARAFGVGADDKRIHVIDSSGVALASIQALYQMMLAKERQLQALQAQVNELRKEVAELKGELVYP